MKVLLICSAGMSTSVLVTKMRGFAAEGDVIEAKAFTELNDAIDNFDVVLIFNIYVHVLQEQKDAAVNLLPSFDDIGVT